MDAQPARPEGDRPRLIGDPVAEVRPGFDLSPAAVRATLRAPSLPKLLALLGVPAADRDLLVASISPIADAPALMSAAATCANLVRSRAGADVPAADLAARAAAWDEAQSAVAPGRGLAALLGCAVGTDVVRTWHRHQGLSAEQSWRALRVLGSELTSASGEDQPLPGLISSEAVARIWAGAPPA